MAKGLKLKIMITVHNLFPSSRRRLSRRELYWRVPCVRWLLLLPSTHVRRCTRSAPPATSVWRSVPSAGPTTPTPPPADTGSERRPPRSWGCWSWSWSRSWSACPRRRRNVALSCKHLVDVPQCMRNWWSFKICWIIVIFLQTRQDMSLYSQPCPRKNSSIHHLSDAVSQTHHQLRCLTRHHDPAQLICWWGASKPRTRFSINFHTKLRWQVWRWVNTSLMLKVRKVTQKSPQHCLSLFSYGVEQSNIFFSSLCQSVHEYSNDGEAGHCSWECC